MHSSLFQSCAYKPERNKKGANLIVAQLVFHKLDLRWLSSYFRKMFVDDYEIQPQTKPDYKKC